MAICRRSTIQWLCECALNVRDTIKHVDCYVPIQMIFNVRMCRVCVFATQFFVTFTTTGSPKFGFICFLLLFFCCCCSNWCDRQCVECWLCSTVIFTHLFGAWSVQFRALYSNGNQSTARLNFERKKKKQKQNQWQRSQESLLELDTRNSSPKTTRKKPCFELCTWNLSAPQSKCLMQTDAVDRREQANAANCEKKLMVDSHAKGHTFISRAHALDRTKIDRIFDVKIVNATCFRSLILSDTSRQLKKKNPICAIVQLSHSSIGIARGAHLVFNSSRNEYASPQNVTAFVTHKLIF